jgi:hypothetical protein
MRHAGVSAIRRSTFSPCGPGRALRDVPQNTGHHLYASQLACFLSRACVACRGLKVFPILARIPASCAGSTSTMDNLAPVNVEIGSVVSLGYNQNGERDIVTYLQHVRPVYFIPNHVTAVAVEGSSLEWKVGFYDALKARNVPQSSWPQILWIVDPNDYLRPIVFDLDHPDPHF